ncbi:hypothetical protein AB1Y20_018635 [Prymnesium parvum]|uniref:Uncharacterized protein n=1 Tax=Prymnesium parvum TaxID=97485 RepID=A0AB34JT27_PRYPA
MANSEHTPQINIRPSCMHMPRARVASSHALSTHAALRCGGRPWRSWLRHPLRGHLHLHNEQLLRECLREAVGAERHGAPSAQRASQHEVEPADPRDLVPAHLALDRVRVPLGDALLREVPPQEGHVLRLPRDDADVGRVALVARPRPAQPGEQDGRTRSCG